MIGTVVAVVLYLLGTALMVDNIRAQPHEGHPYRGYGLVLLFIVVAWPLAVAWNLLIPWRPESEPPKKP